MEKCFAQSKTRPIKLSKIPKQGLSQSPKPLTPNKIRGTQIIWLTVILLSFISLKTSKAQTLIPKTKITLQLSDQTEVILMESLRGKAEGRRMFYYLPTNLRFSTKRRSDTPEFSFLGYRENDNEPLSGGIMHFLITWGLTKEQTEEANSLLYEIDSTAILWGAVMVESETEGGKLDFWDNDKVSQILKRSLKSMGKTPLTPGNKLAVSFHFSGEEAVFMEELLANPAKMDDSEIGLTFYYKIIQNSWSGSSTSLRQMKLTANLKDLFLTIPNP